MKPFSLLAGATAAALLSFPPGRLQAQDSRSPAENEPIELEAVVVTPFAAPRSADDFAQPIFLLQGDRLKRQTTATLGETLDGAAGVSATSFGPGASRPIIRGMGGDRIRVLSDGLGTSDASVISPDHAISIEPMFADRIEVIRGPATLMYGSSAIGGVVHAVSDALPDAPPDQPVSGKLEGRYGTNNDEWTAAGRFSGGTERFGWSASGLKRRSSDIEIPVPPETGEDHDPEDGEHDPDGDHEDHDQEEELFDGTLPNSAVETDSFTFSLSSFWDRGHAGIAYTRYDTIYGIPGGHAHREEEEENEEDHEEHEHGDEPIRVDLEQQRFQARAGLRQPAGWIDELNLRLGYADYEHVELEGDAIGTRFTSESIEGRLEAVHPEVKGFVGAFGLETLQTDFEAAGEEAFVPPTDTEKWSVFAIETHGSERFSTQFGLRFEDQTIDVTDGSGRSVTRSGLSLSAGGVWHLSPDYSLGLSLARTERLPNAQELFADGPHAATRAYEIGDPGLGKEEARSADLVLRKRTGRITGQVSVFATRIDRYIFEERTGDEADGLPVYRFVARAAEFVGGEIEAVLHAHAEDGFQIDLTLRADTVHATDTTRDQPLPRIPPFRVGLGFEVGKDGLAFGAEVRHAASQHRTAPGETPTAASNQLDAHLAYHWVRGETTWRLFLRGTNLTDQEIRTHASFLKDEVPRPGRNLIAGVSMAF